MPVLLHNADPKARVTGWIKRHTGLHGGTAFVQLLRQPLNAHLAAKGPGFETYSVACATGDTMMVRCEFGNCRALR